MVVIRVSSFVLATRRSSSLISRHSFVMAYTRHLHRRQTPQHQDRCHDRVRARHVERSLASRISRQIRRQLPGQDQRAARHGRMNDTKQSESGRDQEEGRRDPQTPIDQRCERGCPQ